MRLVFSLTIFLSAALLFVVEPLFAKMVLPRLGGTPAVWNTCMVFFQAALLAGYAYAHWTGRFAKQPVFHGLLLLAPLAVLPIGVPASWEPPADGASPTGALLLLLLVRVGPPFFVLATSGPLIQRWAARAGEKDPYWLYAASNTGSMIGLLGYPLLLEPNLALAAQSTLWTGGYVALVALTIGCAAVALRGEARATEAAAASEPPPPLAVGRSLRWVALAAVPSAQMLGVTTYMTTDVASVPLLWVIPLALYLLSFILVFSKGGLARHKLWVTWTPLFVLGLTELLLTGARDPVRVVLPVHLVTFFVVCMVCHGELAKDRPPAAQLTAYYLLISVGGLIGGTMTALVAPLVFRDVHEYPLALVAACALMPDRSALAGKGLVKADVLLPLLLGALSLGLVSALGGASHEAAGLRVLAVGVPVLIVFLFSRRPVRFALGLGAVIAATLAHRDLERHQIHAERSFFGIHRVSNEDMANLRADAHVTTETVAYRALTHGSTRHGLQRVELGSLAPTAPREPLSYYRRAGPLGQALQEIVGAAPGKRFGVVGLGTGSIAAYLEAGQKLVYFEIDPAVLRIAEEYFTFMKSARERGATVTTVLGDARLTLAKSAETFDVLAVDAFSSDAIPLHLVTREAIARAYLPRLAPSGVLLFHVSNRYLELRPILADLAGDANLVCYTLSDAVTALELYHGFASSTWVALARRAEDLGPLTATGRWDKLAPRSPPIVWTDDRSDLLSAIKRGE